MKEKMNILQRFGYCLSKKLFLPENILNMKGIFHAEKWSQKKSGNYRKVEEFDFFNGVKNSAKNSFLNTMFNSATQVVSTNWCMSLVDNTGFSAESSNDTMASHGGWSEFTGYSQANRVPWGQGTSTAQLLTNTTLCVFDITTTGSLYGGLIASENTKGGVAGLLWCTGGFPSPVPVTGGTDQMRLGYNLAL